MCTSVLASAVESRLVLDWHYNRYSVNTRLTVDQQLVHSPPSFNWLICINQKLVDCWPTTNQDVNRMLIECQPRCYGVSINYQSSVDWGCRSGVSTNAQMPLVYLIHRIYETVTKNPMSFWERQENYITDNNYTSLHGTDFTLI